MKPVFEEKIEVLSRSDDHPSLRIDELTPHGWIESKNA